jgi:serine beta-lactamase-like protein LACTB, mitochondrial
MEPTKKPLPTWLMVAGVVALTPFAVVVGVWEYMNATAATLYEDALGVPSTRAFDPDPKWADAAEDAARMVRTELAERNLPGLSVTVSAGGRIVWAEGFGFADLERQAPITPNTRFRIGTASVALTSAAVGLLLEKGMLDLDKEIQAYVPEFPRKQRPITLRQLMGHTAGLRTDGGDEGPLFGRHCRRPVEAVPSFVDLPALFDPGTAFEYSSYGWILVSAAIESVAKEPFMTVMRKQVFEPLGMNDTLPDIATLESAPAPVPGQAISYFPRFAADTRYGPDPMRPIDYSCYSGSSAFLSTPSDLVRFATAMSGGSLLEPATAKLLQTPQRLPSGEETGHGLGWDLEMVTLSGKPTAIVGHNGNLLGGMAVSLMTLPEHDLVVAVTSNISYAGTDGIALTVARAFAK